MLIVSSSDVVGDVREGVIVQGEEPASEKAARHDVYILIARMWTR